MRSKLNALTQERADLIAEGKELLGLAEREDRDLAEDEQKRDDDIEARLDEIKGLIAREERQVAREGLVDPVQAVNPNGENAEPGPSTVTPFKSFGAQLAAVAAAAAPGGSVDPRLMLIQAATGASEGVGSEGGFLVQTDFSAELLRLVHQTGVLLGLCSDTPIGPNSNGLKINAIDETSRADGSRWGGVQAYWIAEAGVKTDSKPKFRQVELNLKKLAGLFYATDELLMDATALGSVAQEAFAEEFGFKVDDAIIRGSGAGVPLGILGHAGTVSIAKVTGQAANTILLANIEDMYARMWARSIPNAKWFINQDCWPQLFQLSQAVGVGGVPVFLPSNSISGAPFGTLLGRPIQPIEQCETVGTVGDIIFADFSQYKTISKGGIQGASSIHVKFAYDETVFRFVLRMDGQPKRVAPLTPFKGGATKTLSPFVTLASRD